MRILLIHSAFIFLFMKWSAKQISQAIDSFRRLNILVVGDLMLDAFIWGKVSRISPEAPVPVVEVDEESFYPGGAANVARNLRPFCNEVNILGLKGKDSAGDNLAALLEAEKISLQGVLIDPERPTIVKTRIIARQQQVVRVDREHHFSPDPEQTEEILRRLDQFLPITDAIILEDYAKGFFSQSLLDAIVERAKRANVLVTADISPRNLLRWQGCYAVKPNRLEAFVAAGIPLTEPVDPPEEDQALLQTGQRLHELWGCPLLLITLGEQGMMLFEKGLPAHHIPTRAREVFDVSGAGDTAISLFTLALAAKCPPALAAELSNHASGVVVAKLGTATLAPAELLESFHFPSHETSAGD